ncbi:MAG TPA: c-type cytochrome biogenesis protein CcsB [Stackebrandtia sp.]|jgi:cytochrome c-type biogenesis protein CcsB|uniref:c-type cytochrome biogenesis protein CcsB n=1 Tax=Stackebrandtia sp. TaxID=2023065 RepID=UPI002D5D22A8|nr:c-type cytochrome biogenesis protein CcsB [Stackebrandtia sp.]HZE38841.1 c-type cytochrome biogenesis protein CcsB [Stackebrandtia sp.]
MGTNGLAELSNATFVAAIVLYAVAMFGYAIEYAFSRRASMAAESEVEHRELVTVGAGGDLPADDAPEPDDAPANNSGITPAQALAAGKVGLVAMIAAAVVHAATLALRAGAVGRWPWGNMFEFIVALCLVCVVVWTVVVARGLVARRLGLFTMLAVVLLLGCATRVYTQATPLVPALNSYWIAIHVLAAIIATGLFLTGFVTAVLHLIRRNYHRVTERGGTLRFPFTIAPRLPEESRLETLTWRLHVLAFPIWTFAVIAGAIWAREAWSRYWGWDPKEVWAFIAWVVYAAYLHSRATGAGGRRFAPWIAILGWGVILFNLFGVNLFVHSMHSYAGV